MVRTFWRWVCGVGVEDWEFERKAEDRDIAKVFPRARRPRALYQASTRHI